MPGNLHYFILVALRNVVTNEFKERFCMCWKRQSDRDKAQWTGGGGQENLQGMNSRSLEWNNYFCNLMEFMQFSYGKNVRYKKMRKN